MRIHKSGNKSVEFFIAYMNLFITAEKATVETVEHDMIKQFFKDDTASLGPVTFTNFQKALSRMRGNEE